MLHMFEIPFDAIMQRATQNCEKDGSEWHSNRLASPGKKQGWGVSESRKRTYILDAEQQILREMQTSPA